MVWRRLHRARGHVPPLLHMAGHGGTVSRRTANKKLTELYWPSRKRSPKRLVVLLEPKKWRDTTQKIFWRFAPDRCPPPHFRAGKVPLTFKFVPAPLPISPFSSWGCLSMKNNCVMVWWLSRECENRQPLDVITEIMMIVVVVVLEHNINAVPCKDCTILNLTLTLTLSRYFSVTIMRLTIFTFPVVLT